MYQINTEILKQRRIEKQLSQKELANLIFLDQSNYSKIELGKILPKMDIIKKISDALDISPNQWVKFNDNAVYNFENFQNHNFININYGELISEHPGLKELISVFQKLSTDIQQVLTIIEQLIQKEKR
ncbi:MAG: helix-turn-helix transcriptional regulator [Alphaproteobacteria bacterium]|nr:helix-turn-helix transcriptional regulator [Alphaproteobacteria bacterium]